MGTLVFIEPDRMTIPTGRNHRMSLNRKNTTAGVIAALALIPATAFAADITGGPGNERLRGTNGPDTIDGNAGNDRIFGLAGADRLIGGSGNDRIFGGKGDDVISGVQGNDFINGGSGDDQISGDGNGVGDLTSFDRLFGAAGNDTIRGGDSRDRIYGGSGNDTTYGENGRDLMAGGAGNDTQYGGAGNDVIFANEGVDTSFGGDGNDVLWALARKDVKPGPNGEVDQVGDTLAGGNGDDRFRTRDGEVDRITCGPGQDVARLDNVDVITDATAEKPNGSCEKVERANPEPSSPEDAQSKVKDESKQS